MNRADEIAREAEQMALDSGLDPEDRKGILAFSVGVLSQRLAAMEPTHYPAGESSITDFLMQAI